MLNRSKLWASGLLIAMFVTGAAVGGGITQAWMRNDDPTDYRGRGSSDRSRPPSYADRIEVDLNLTPEQRAAVDTILARRESDMQQLWQDIQPRFDALRDTIRTKIMDVLTEEQQQKYRELLEHGSRRGERDRENRTHN
ncbi:MAG: periplasmic heavy metal sensor [Gemmatimonadota bacterium]|nr:MAG: periplasmic heavy metal sensor [Gemmatimonadota bacterium]